MQLYAQIIASILIVYFIQANLLLYGETKKSSVTQNKPSLEWCQELQMIDETIEQLTDLRDKELAKATQAQNQGDRLQFQPENLLDAKRFWTEAETSREIAARYQKEIDQLELKRKSLLTNHRS